VSDHRKNPRAGHGGKKWFCVDIPLIEYQEAWSLQAEIVLAIKDKTIDRNVVLFLEHPSVFTLGRRGGRNNLNVSEAFLESQGIPLVHVERGGDITYHGPGQLVAYPVLDLRGAGLDVVGHVTKLEDVMIRTARDFGVKAERNPLNRGVWVGNNKLGSIGIAIRRGITFHGFALNVNLTMEPFTWIQPCGLQGIGMTSLGRELVTDVSMRKARERARSHMEAVFGVALETIGLEELRAKFKSKRS